MVLGNRRNPHPCADLSRPAAKLDNLAVPRSFVTGKSRWLARGPLLYS